MKTSDFNYELPPELIAQTPANPRDSSRLLVFNRADGAVYHSRFRNLQEFLTQGDLLVINQTRVIPARLIGTKYPTGGKAEILLLNQISKKKWEGLVGGKRIRMGGIIRFETGLDAEVLSDLGGARRLLKFNRPLDEYLIKYGETPLPPYIRQTLTDPELYQTVFSKILGSAAAPTAGLHFTPTLFDRLFQRGIQVAKLTLHIGLDTFSPVTVNDPNDHQIHSEWCQIPADTAELVNRTKRTGQRVVAVGTTSVRALETGGRLAAEEKTVQAFEGPTDLFILPGYSFNIVDAMITNFHLPKTSLLMLVSAFAGKEEILKLYNLAIAESYRFYSFGDAMLIL